MIRLNEKVLKTLEYDKILNLLADKATSELGRKKCLNTVPSTDIKVIERLLLQTDDALARLLRNSNISFGNNIGVASSLKRLDKGSAITAQEILIIAKLLENTGRIKAYNRTDNEESSNDSLKEYFDSLVPLTPLITEIRRCIISEDEIADDASSELKSIRRLIKSTGDKIHSQLNNMVNNTYRSYLQDNVITMRDGRYCIPVKAEYKSYVQGMVHDQSSSMSTFFIEPAGIVNLNNEIRELEIKEAREIERILAILSESIGQHTEEIRNNQLLLTRLDYIFARGRLALDMKASRPEYNTEGIINLKKARHPLLDDKKVVPIDIRLGDDFDLLIITGPNTGGKTVALKTVGLITLMGQSGLMIPAKDHSVLSVFSEVFADIGDEQSIEQSLSTFSSHLKNIVEILNNADTASLCLFDELGAGTDPTEGAALACSILDDLHHRKIRTVATTHYSEIKIYALTEEGVCNASCEFDIETLAPTYRLLIGVPGKSNAFAISKKLGLPGYIIDKAKERIDKKDESFEDVLTELEKNRIRMEEEKLTISSYKEEIERLKNEYETKKNKLNAERDRILREAREEASAILTDAKESADKAIKNFRKYGNIQDMEAERAKVRKKLEDVRPTVDFAAGHRVNNKLSDFKIGESVRILSMDLKGTVSTIPDSKGNLYVQCGIMRIQANMNDIEFIEAEDTGKKGGKKTYYQGNSLSKASSMSVELNLIGLTVDEAIPKLEKYLDDAYLSHLESVRIVHGKGTGALRNGIWNQLKRIKYVKSYKLAEYGEGDAGVTIVTFK